MAEFFTHQTREQAVDRPGPRFLTRSAELHSRHVNDVGHIGQLGQLGRVQEIAANRLDAPGLQRGLLVSLGESCHADDPPGDAGAVRGSSGHARQGRTHLSGHSQQHQVALQMSERIDDLFGRLAQKFFQMLRVLDTIHAETP